MSSLGPARITHATVEFDLTGGWRAEGLLDKGNADAIPRGAQTLTIGDLACRGTVLDQSAEDAPDRPHFVLVGGAGWALAATDPLAWQNPACVRLSVVLRELAQRSGEIVELPAEQSLGDAWSCIATRPGEPLRYRDALAALVRDRYVAPWRVDPDGVTRFGRRSLPDVPTSAATVMFRDAGVGLAIVGGETFARFLPGATFEGALVTRLVVTERPKVLRAEVYTQQAGPMASILRKVGEAFPALFYGYPRTYRVAAANADGTLDLDPLADAPHLKTLPRVPVWGPGGARVTPLVGSLAVVVFRDARPSRPTVVALEPLAASTPTKVKIDAAAVEMGGAVDNAARYGDKVAIDPVTGILSFVSTVARPDVSRVKV